MPYKALLSKKLIYSFATLVTIPFYKHIFFSPPPFLKYHIHLILLVLLASGDLSFCPGLTFTMKCISSNFLGSHL